MKNSIEENPRKGWVEDFKQMHELGEDVEMLVFDDELEWENI